MPNPTDEATDLDAQAAQWLVRVMSADVTDQDISGLSDWLDASPAHLDAYARVEAVWDEAGALPNLTVAPSNDNVVPLSARRPAVASGRNGWMMAVGAIAAACAAAAIFITLPGTGAHSKSVTYATAKGERRAVTLADGSELQLNTDSKVSLTFTEKQRKIVLDQGEVALNVVHDPSRPLTLTAGDAVIRDIGTRFDVRRDARNVIVTVTEGRVSVGRAEATSPAEISAGQQVAHPIGTAVFTPSTVNAPSAFAWQQGRAVYRDARLADVVSDLNRYLDKPLVVDTRTGQLRLTAVIAIDSEAQIVRSLEAFLPVKAVANGDRIELRAKH